MSDDISSSNSKVFTFIVGAAAIVLVAVLAVVLYGSSIKTDDKANPTVPAPESLPTPTLDGADTTTASNGTSVQKEKNSPKQPTLTQSDGDDGDYPWDKKTTFEILNKTNSQYSDDQIYWAIVGRDPASGNFVHIQKDGSAKEMALADNGALTKDGLDYTNYFHTIAELDATTIDPIDSARLFLSVGSPMYLQVNVNDAGEIAYAGANVENPSDPNHDIYFDFAEMAIVEDLGIFVNTSRVDHFGFPVRLRLEGGGGYDRTVGEFESRDELIKAFNEEVPTEFTSLYDPAVPQRIIAPAHSTFKVGEPNGTYLDSYIDEVWEKYRSEDLVFTIQSGTYRGRVSGDVFSFTREDDGAGPYFINGKPTTEMAMLGNGLLDDKQGAPADNGHIDQLQIQAQMTAALNRRVADTPEEWQNHDAFHPEGLASNSYAEFWHRHSIDNLAYGFSYDDVSEYSPSLHSTSPEKVTIEVGW